eukprot:Hpha_TRINITY_DN16834_c4_g10::TRINITY_DN16834_c4_g10_i1::g.152312::m.152312
MGNCCNACPLECERLPRVTGESRPEPSPLWGEGGLHVFANSRETLSDAEPSPSGSFSSSSADSDRQLYESILGVRSPTTGASTYLTSGTGKEESLRSQFSRLLRRHSSRFNRKAIN